MDLRTKVVLTLLLYGAVILGGCLSLVLARTLPEAIRQWWRGGSES